MSKREHNTEEIPFYDNLVFWAPLTDNGDDLIGGKQYNISGSVYYSEDGVYVNNNSYTHYDYPNTEQSQPLTLFFKLKVNSLVNEYDYVIDFGMYYSRINYHRAAIFTQRASGKMGFDLNTYNYSYEGYMDNIVLNKWYKAVFTFVNNEQKVYIDSSLKYSNYMTDTFGQTEIQGGRLVLGNRMDFPANNGRTSNCNIKDVRIYNRALTAEEVAQL